MKIIDSREKDIAAELKRIVNRGETATEEVAAAVKEVVGRVRKEGDPAVIEYTEKFDKVKLTLKDIKVSPDEIKASYDHVEPKKVEALKLAAQNIRAFHEKQKLTSWVNQEADGVILGQIARPIRSVGVYVPGGKACYPSTVLMNVIPAKVAGVEQLIMCSPATGGALNPYILVAADIAGVTEIFRIGGAQAVAAMAYGTATVPKVDKIVGPGNIYVATAKRQVFGQVDIDMIAGPSEILVIADHTANPTFVASDLLSQAEHDELASALLVTTSREFAGKVDAEVERQLANLARKEIARKALDRFGAIILTASLKEAADVSNSIAPEHLELARHQPCEVGRPHVPLGRPLVLLREVRTAHREEGLVPLRVEVDELHEYVAVAPADDHPGLAALDKGQPLGEVRLAFPPAPEVDLETRTICSSHLISPLNRVSGAVRARASAPHACARLSPRRALRVSAPPSSPRASSPLSSPPASGSAPSATRLCSSSFSAGPPSCFTTPGLSAASSIT